MKRQMKQYNADVLHNEDGKFVYMYFTRTNETRVTELYEPYSSYFKTFTRDISITLNLYLNII